MDIRGATLAYHDVVSSGCPDESGFLGRGPATYKLDWDSFSAHLDALEHAGLRPRSATDEVGPRVTLTFDDGGACSRVLAELLTDRGWVGCFLVVSSLIGASGFATEADVRAIHQLGHKIGSHSATHPARLSALAPSDIAREWAESAEVLSEIIGEMVMVGSVPGGYTSTAVERAAGEAGFRTVYTSRPTTRQRTIDRCTVSGRFAIRSSTTAEDVVSLATGSGWNQRLQAIGWALRVAPKRVLGPAYPKIRRALKESGL